MTDVVALLRRAIADYPGGLPAVANQLDKQSAQLDRALETLAHPAKGDDKLGVREVSRLLEILDVAPAFFEALQPGSKAYRLPTPSSSVPSA